MLDAEGRRVSFGIIRRSYRSVHNGEIIGRFGAAALCRTLVKEGFRGWQARGWRVEIGQVTRGDMSRDLLFIRGGFLDKCRVAFKA